mmetsp:Transcript_843/g.1769  ORF Transcript_843/g.1769 Transcript_843/m.1769 type:complete len:119 (+) Transcript_843:96-452(+)|eukprot:CAMPEP_0114253064 /NCGR_PEP_ID=MMETSP0058-20121206/16187_1 /TAXON_ID=36894 /ORGANISM="Pyramimonas parkeae, CCMP726" /LENGTH=118 /DNA_ID=CAMNT_0001367073 /DNA_START=61 /DNA_END=417 /DNA_ORIENTATION=+
MSFNKASSSSVNFVQAISRAPAIKHQIHLIQPACAVYKQQKHTRVLSADLGAERRKILLSTAATLFAISVTPAASADDKCLKKCVKECNKIAPGSPEYCKMACEEDCTAPSDAAKDED